LARAQKEECALLLKDDQVNPLEILQDHSADMLLDAAKETKSSQIIHKARQIFEPKETRRGD